MSESVVIGLYQALYDFRTIQSVSKTTDYL